MSIFPFTNASSMANRSSFVRSGGFTLPRPPRGIARPKHVVHGRLLRETCAFQSRHRSRELMWQTLIRAIVQLGQTVMAETSA